MTFKRVFAGMAAVLALMLVSGCARIVSVAEVLQQPLDSSVYTACNIWFQDPNNISSVNYQKGGRFIPMGTKIEVLEADERKIVFKDDLDNQFTIHYDKQMMMTPIEQYILQIFTLKNREVMLEGVDPEVVRDIDKGLIVKGMSRPEVMMACGPPPKYRTPDLNNTTWIYFLDRNKTYRVIFSGRYVETLMSIND